MPASSSASAAGRQRGVTRCAARLPVAVGDHPDAGVDGDDGAHAGQFLGGARVESVERAAELWCAQHHRRQQPGQGHVDAELRPSGDLGQVVDARGGFADVAVVRRRPARRVFRHRQARRERRELAVAQTLPRRTQHLAHGSPASGPLDLPGPRSGGDQHGPRRRAGLRQRIPGVADARTAAGTHRTHVEVIGRVFIRHRQAHGGQIHVELVRQNGGKTAVRALPHLGLVQREGDGAVRRHADEGVRHERRFVLDSRQCGQAQSQTQPPGDARAAHHKRPPAEADHVTPPAPARRRAPPPGECADRCRSDTGCRGAQCRWRPHPAAACAPAAPWRP